jgi:hypothetical protein
VELSRPVAPAAMVARPALTPKPKFISLTSRLVNGPTKPTFSKFYAPNCAMSALAAFISGIEAHYEPVVDADRTIVA